MNTIISKVYLMIGTLVLFVIIWSLSFVFLQKKAERANADFNQILAVGSQLSELILSEMLSLDK